MPELNRPQYARKIPAHSVGKGIGHFFGALQIDGFIDKDEFKKQIDDWIHFFRNTKPAPGNNGPLIPGDHERSRSNPQQRRNSAIATGGRRFAGYREKDRN